MEGKGDMERGEGRIESGGGGKTGKDRRGLA